MSLEITEDKVEAMRSWLKKCDSGLVDSNIDALCNLALQALYFKKNPMLTYKAFDRCSYGCNNGYIYDRDGCYPHPCPIHGNCGACAWEADVSNYRGPGSEGPEHTCVCQGGKLSHENCEGAKI